MAYEVTDETVKDGAVTGGALTDDATAKMLIAAALEAREMAYAPYSGFLVGAALLTEEGQVYTGCNVENAAFGPGNCAERTAFFKAVSEGKRQFRAIAVAGGLKDREITDYAAPCGVCRQVMAEFCRPEQFEIIVARSVHDYRRRTLQELLPDSFGPAHLRPR